MNIGTIALWTKRSESETDFHSVSTLVYWKCQGQAVAMKRMEKVKSPIKAEGGKNKREEKKNKQLQPSWNEMVT